MAAPHLRHQTSLEDILNFSESPPTLAPDKRAQAERRFYVVVKHFDDDAPITYGICNRVRLVRLTYEYAMSQVSRDIFLQVFFQAVELSMEEDKDIDLDDQELKTHLFGFANHLLDTFFLPMRASGLKTPQPSPAYHSAIERLQGGPQDFAGTEERTAALRGACLVRDHHRCVVTRKFDLAELVKRRRQCSDPQDDEGNPLRGQFATAVEVCHIVPHALCGLDQGSSQLSPGKRAALAILNMFDYGVVRLIEGTDVDRPYNAISLDRNLHVAFGDFLIFFTPIPGQEHTYRIEALDDLNDCLQDIPVTRTLLLSATRTIDPPSPRLLALHRAIAHILHLSGAGDYLYNLLRDLDDNGVRADGSTDLGCLVKLGLGGWLDNSKVVAT